MSQISISNHTIYTHVDYPSFCMELPKIRFMRKAGTKGLISGSCTREKVANTYGGVFIYEFTIDGKIYKIIEQIKEHFWIYKENSTGGKKRTRRNCKSKYRKQRKSRKSNV